MIGNSLTAGTSLGFFGRLKNSLFGVLVGLLFVSGAVALLGWNEYRTVQRSRGLAEAAGLIQTIPDIQQPAPQLNNSLVHLGGMARADGELRDVDFQVVSKGLRLQRQVELFQWHEETESAKQSNSSRGEKREVRYEQKWSRKPIDSSKFKQPEQHRNPAPRYREQTYDAPKIQVGVYELSDSLKSAISNWTDIALDIDSIMLALPEEQWEHFSGDVNQLYYSTTGGSPDSPQVGDLRIKFTECLPTDVSVAAKLQGGRLEDFRTSNGQSIERLFMGQLSAADIMNRLVTENTIVAWGIRFGGTFLCVVGFTLILGPISAMTSFIPILGRLTSGLVFLAAVLMSVVLCSMTIAIAWIAVRPVLGVSLLVVSGIGVFLLFRLRAANTPSSLPQAMGQ